MDTAPGGASLPSGIRSRVLVVAEDHDLRQTLQIVLAEEGFAPVVVSSLGQALAAVTQEPFDLIVANLYVGRAKTSLTPAHIVRRRVFPTPMGLLTTRSPLPPEVEAAGFAFVLPMPFDIDDLMGCIAAALAAEWTAVRERRAQVVRRFFAALEAEDWMSALALCTDQIRYYPPATSPVSSARAMEGKDAYLAYMMCSAQFYPFAQFDELRLYPIPKGLAARYLCRWVTPEDVRERQVGTAIFHFVGEQIAQIGSRMMQRESRAELSSSAS